MIKKLEMIEALVFFLIGAVVLATSIIQQSGIGAIVIGALLMVAGVLHFIINVK